MNLGISTHPQGAYIGSRVWKWTQQEFVTSVYYAHKQERPVLLHAPPASGKTYSAIEQSAGFQRAGEWPPITYLARREELYDQAEQLATKFGLTAEVLPSPHRSCPCFDEQAPDYDPRVERLYELGIQPSTLHEKLDLACESNCEYAQKWQEISKEPRQYDLLIGHPLHAHAPSVTTGRIVIFDEFPVNLFVMTFEHPKVVVTRYLQRQGWIPFSDWEDLLERRDSSLAISIAPRLRTASVTAQALLNLTAGERHHQLAPLLVYAVIAGEDLGNGIEYAELNDGKITLYEKERNQITIFTPPTFREANPDVGKVEPWAVLGLDGTPCRPLWNLLFQRDLKQRTVLSEEQRRAFEKTALGLTLYRVGRGLKPYDGRYVNPQRDAEILREIQELGQKRPTIISTKNAERQYTSTEVEIDPRSARIPDLVGQIEHYGDIKSLNELDDTTVGCVFGAPHPGDDVIRRWCGLLGLPTDISGRGMNKEYGGPTQNAVYEQFVHDQVYQAVMRFVRGDSPATVYVTTEAIEKWIEPDGVKYYIPDSRPTKSQVITILKKRSPLTTSEVTESVDVSQDRVRQILGELEKEDHIELIQPGQGPQPAMWGWDTASDGSNE